MFYFCFALKIKTHDNLESLYKHLPKHILPLEYLPDDYTGQSAGPVKNIIGRLEPDSRIIHERPSVAIKPSACKHTTAIYMYIFYRIITANFKAEVQTDAYRQHFLDRTSAKYCLDETKKPKLSHDSTESFRKLNVD